MEIQPHYSYEFNCVLNSNFTEMEQVKNFASLLSDKDRFLAYLSQITGNKELIEKTLGVELPDTIECYVVRAEQFKSFSLPITIEYSILPEEMVLFLLKEIIKSHLNLRFPDEQTREEYVNATVDFIVINGEWEGDIVKYCKNLHDESKRLYPQYEYRELNFSKKSLYNYVEELFDEQ